MPDGIIYGLIDNGVLAFATVLGIDIDKYFKGSGVNGCLLYTSPSPRDTDLSRMPSSA